MDGIKKQRFQGHNLGPIDDNLFIKAEKNIDVVAVLGIFEKRCFLDEMAWQVFGWLENHVNLIRRHLPPF